MVPVVEIDGHRVEIGSELSAAVVPNNGGVLLDIADKDDARNVRKVRNPLGENSPHHVEVVADEVAETRVESSILKPGERRDLGEAIVIVYTS